MGDHQNYQQGDQLQLKAVHNNPSTPTSSGSIQVKTADSGTINTGAGSVGFETGNAISASAGSLIIKSGASTGGGGTITLSVGDGDTGVGGDVNINAARHRQVLLKVEQLFIQVEPVHKGLVVKYRCLPSMVVYRVIWR